MTMVIKPPPFVRPKRQSLATYARINLLLPTIDQETLKELNRRLGEPSHTPVQLIKYLIWHCRKRLKYPAIAWRRPPNRSHRRRWRKGDKLLIGRMSDHLAAKLLFRDHMHIKLVRHMEGIPLWRNYDDIIWKAQYRDEPPDDPPDA